MKPSLLASKASEGRPPIVLYSTSRWDGIWRPRHEFARLLARRGWRVVYTTGPLSTWDVGGDDWGRTPWLGGFDRVGSLYVDRPGRLPLRWQGRLLDAPVLQWHASKVRALAGARGRREIVAIAFDPVFLPHVEALRPLHCVYMQYEALAHLPQVRYGFHELERRLVARADMVISLTKPMAQVLPGSGAVRARLLPSAVRFDEFRQAEARPCPPDLAAIARPRIGYVGSITVALDFELILEVARSRPHWQLVFIGPVARDGGTESVGDSACDAKWRAVRALPNVHYLAQKPAGEVPAYMAHMDVNALWYRTAGEGWWLRGSPIKLYENLAVGKPVVGARLAAIQDFEGIVDIADTPQQWLCAIDRALESGSPVDVARRISVARENSWDKRVDVLESWIVEMVAARANTGRRCVIDAETLAAMKREAGRP